MAIAIVAITFRSLAISIRGAEWEAVQTLYVNERTNKSEENRRMTD